jgi:cobalt-zinc-cadmium efflux system outer membrane protein
LRTIAFLFLYLAPGISLAQPAPTALTLDAAVAEALRHNPLARAGIHQVQAARAGIGAARALPNPSITLAPGLLGPAGSDEELSVAQPLEVSGVRGARTGVARAGLQAARSEAVAATRDLVRDVKRAYFELARAQEVLDLQQGSVAVAEEYERIARRQVELGSRPGIDLTQLQVELTRARQLQLQAETGVRLAEADLNTLMGRLPETPVAISSLAFASPAAAAPADIEAAPGRRAEVAARQAELEALRQQSRLLRAESRPDLVLGGRLETFTRTPRLGGVNLGISLPLLDYGSRRERRRQTDQRAEAQAARVEAARSQVRLEVQNALTRLRTAERLVRQYDEGLVAQAQRLAEAERTRFQTGAGSPLAVLEAQRTYRSVLSDYYAALAAHEQAKADLEWALGTFEVPVELFDPEVTEDRKGSTRRRGDTERLEGKGRVQDLGNLAAPSGGGLAGVRTPSASERANGLDTADAVRTPAGLARRSCAHDAEWPSLEVREMETEGIRP